MFKKVISWMVQLLLDKLLSLVFFFLFRWLAFANEKKTYFMVLHDVYEVIIDYILYIKMSLWYLAIKEQYYYHM